MKVEVEGKEGFIENSFGDRAIIPKDKWGEVQKMIDEGCYDCIDRFVANLPKYSDYAATGSTIPSDQRSPSGGSEVPEDGKSVLERLKTSQTHEMTRSNYPKYDEQAINRQLEFHQDLQYAEETGIEDDFRKKWGTSVHKWKYDHDPEYKASHTLSPQEQKISDERHGTIGFPITDVRRSAPPNSQWMYPQLQGEAQAKQARISNEIIQAGLPIPGLNKIGKMPGLLDEALGLAGKELSKAVTPIASSVDDVAKNLEHLEYAKAHYSKYGYDIPENLLEIAKDSKKTDEVIQGLVNQHNTFVRGVSTNWDVIEKRNPEILRHLEGKGINWKENPQAAAEYMSTHVPINTGYGRAGFGKSIENMDAIYTSNSVPTAEGYTYGDGFIVKVRRPTDFSSKNRVDWIERNKFQYDEITKVSREQGLNDIISVKNHYMNNPDKLSEIMPDNYISNTGLTRDEIFKLPRSLRDAEIEDVVRKITNANDQSLYGINSMKKPIRKMESAISKEYSDISQYLDDLPDDIYPAIKKDLEAVEKNIRNKYKEQLNTIDKKTYEHKYGTIDWYRARQEFQRKVVEFNNELHEEIVATLITKHNIVPNQYAHYLHIGTPGEKLLEPIEAIRITPDIWKNKSRAHTNVFTKGMSAGSVMPLYLYLQSQKQE